MIKTSFHYHYIFRWMNSHQDPSTFSALSNAQLRAGGFDGCGHFSKSADFVYYNLITT